MTAQIKTAGICRVTGVAVALSSRDHILNARVTISELHNQMYPLAFAGFV